MLAFVLAMAQQPDVVVYILDDVAAADLAMYGGPVETPALAALAALGTTYTRAYANASCSPTRRSILTGKWSSVVADTPCGAAGPNDPTLSEVFLPEAMPGYSSALVGKWHLGGDPLGGAWERAPVSHGFDVWLAGLAKNVVHCGGVNYRRWWRSDALSLSEFSSGLATTYQPVAVRDAAISWFTAARGPRLMVVASQLAHEPLQVPPSVLLPDGYPNPIGNRQIYEAMIVAGDTLLGQLLATLDLERTLVIVIGDNGTPDKVAPVSGKAKPTTFERGVRVPLVVAGPGFQKGAISDRMVHAVDVYRTAVEAAGYVAQGDGVSLVSKATHEFVKCGHSGDVASVSIWSKLRRLDDDGDGTVDREEFYDLVADPEEMVNLIDAPKRAAEAAAHRAFLESIQ